MLFLPSLFSLYEITKRKSADFEEKQQYSTLCANEFPTPIFQDGRTVPKITYWGEIMKWQALYLYFITLLSTALVVVNSLPAEWKPPYGLRDPQQSPIPDQRGPTSCGQIMD